MQKLSIFPRYDWHYQRLCPEAVGFHYPGLFSSSTFRVTQSSSFHIINYPQIDTSFHPGMPHPLPECELLRLFVLTQVQSLLHSLSHLLPNLMTPPHLPCPRTFSKFFFSWPNLFSKMFPTPKCVLPCEIRFWQEPCWILQQEALPRVTAYTIPQPMSGLPSASIFFPLVLSFSHSLPPLTSPWSWLSVPTCSEFCAEPNLSFPFQSSTTRAPNAAINGMNKVIVMLQQYHWIFLLLSLLFVLWLVLFCFWIPSK